MPNPTKIVIDCSTNVAQEVEMTDEEISAAQATSAEVTAKYEEQKAAQAAKEVARQSGIAKLLSLGLTAEEAAALTGN
jgi:hypothetical protein